MTKAPADLDSLTAIGNGLVRPECVLATRSGDLYCADWRGGVSHLHPDGIQSQRLRNISSIAFAGTDRRTAVLGCLLGDRLQSLRLPVAGVAPIHWNYPT